MIKINLKPKKDLHLGDCLEVLKTMPGNSVDSVVTDAPYGISFMGKKWDYDVPSKEVFAEMLRVLKPGGHMLCACGTRTQHRMAVNIEDGGFEIRDVITWLYGQGFPKSMDISKAIDKQGGILKQVSTGETCPDIRSNCYGNPQRKERLEIMKSIPNSPEAAKWRGFGTALKPAAEFFTLARKPLSEKTVASNVLKHGTGGINVDGCRVGSDPIKSNGGGFSESFRIKEGRSDRQEPVPSVSNGRFPANLILDEEAAMALDEQSGVLKSGSFKEGQETKESENTCMKGKNYARTHKARSSDSGGASRFFYVAKASKSERNLGLEGLEVHRYGAGLGQGKDPSAPSIDKNFHPTVKPIKLMTYLCRLITPPDGIVLDPFMGSGSTGVAAIQEGFGFIGIEREPSYFEISKARIGRAG